MTKIETIIKAAAKLKVKKVETHLNHAGAPSYYRSLPEQVVCILTTGTLGDTYYATGNQLAEEALGVLLEAREKCPDFLARALVYARNEGLMKTLPVLGLVVLSGGKGVCKSLFESIFSRVILTPDDLRDFVVITISGKIPGRKGLGGITRDAARTWLQGISEYHTVKYGSANSHGIALRDILRMSHPKPESEVIAERFGWLVKGRKGLNGNVGLNPQIRSLEALKSAATEEEVIALIRQGRLPYEVVVPTVKATTPAIWSELLRQAPYFNLLRNLNALTRHGVFQNDENVRYAVDKLTNQQAVGHSKVLPFRFFDAWSAYTQNGDSDYRIADALREALEISFVNMPSLGNRVVAIGTDTSGSMESPISDKGTTRFIDIAGIFTGALMKRIEGRAIPLPFDTHIHTNHDLSSRDDILVTAEKIASYGGGGTAVSAPVQYLLDRKIRADAFIGITDSEEWAYGRGYYASGSFLELWRRYRTEINPKAKAFLVTIAPYRDAVAPSGEQGVHFIYGWNDQCLKYISLKLESGEGQIEQIEKMAISIGGSENGHPAENARNAQIDEG
jgi:60 kDa SS-A/Ro ribonucleoprotein